MFEQTFKALDNIMFQQPGCNSELDYAEQSSWMLFLKYLDDLETERTLEAQMTGGVFKPLFDEQYRWSVWATPQDFPSPTMGGFEPDNHFDFQLLKPMSIFGTKVLIFGAQTYDIFMIFTVFFQSKGA